MVSRGITSVQIILAYGQEQGIDSSLLLHGADITPLQLSTKDHQITGQQELAVLNNLLTCIQDPFTAGIELGNRYHLFNYGIVGYALLSSGTMRKAIEVGLRYIALTYAFSDIQLIDKAESSRLEFTCDIEGDLGTLILMRDLWAVCVIQKELFAGNQLELNIDLKGSKPAHLSAMAVTALESRLGGKLRFNKKYNAIADLSDALERPLLQANETTARICEDQCRHSLQKKQNWKVVSVQVRDSLLHLGLHSSMEEVASQMARASRTLHRQLKEEGTSWRQVRDDVRMGLAEELLAQPLQLDEIAERLGYSDGANFSHSFKRCTGMTPSAYRNKQLEGLSIKS